MNSTSSRPSFRVFLLVVLALAAGFWIGLERQQESSGPRSGDTTVSDEPTAAITDRGPETGDGDRSSPSNEPIAAVLTKTPPVGTAQLPPLDTSLPLATQMSTLLQRLQQGDPVAACRIAIDKIRCTSARLSGAFARDITKQAARGNSILGENKTIDFLATREERLQATADYCANADDESLPEIQDFPKQALARLSTRQKVILALVRQDGSIARFPRDGSARMNLSGTTQFMLPQFLADNMQRFLEQGVTDADPLALEGMLIMHYPFFDLSVARVPSVSLPNPEAFARHAYLTEEALGAGSLGSFGRQALLAIENRLPVSRVTQLRAEGRILAVAWKSRASQARTVDSLESELSLANLCTN